MQVYISTYIHIFPDIHWGTLSIYSLNYYFYSGTYEEVCPLPNITFCKRPNWCVCFAYNRCRLSSGIFQPSRQAIHSVRWGDQLAAIWNLTVTGNQSHFLLSNLGYFIIMWWSKWKFPTHLGSLPVAFCSLLWENQTNTIRKHAHCEKD